MVAEAFRVQVHLPESVSEVGVSEAEGVLGNGKSTQFVQYF